MLYSPVNYWGASPEKKSASVVVTLEGACGAPRLTVAFARLVDLKAALLLAFRGGFCELPFGDQLYTMYSR